eukprot:TRINITY_DN3392_c0_g1_i1.p1 TRINITY_DN3392_c0_g1~~TRINITY_DN3392_c0_g1_i1.p1  ORF type:complete len:890 (+),score=122.20 TRINITY_DN3392_c0_g1_i1:254-2923(+)
MENTHGLVSVQPQLLEEIVDPSLGTLAHLGGKGLHCWELVQNGFRVPPALVLPAALYCQHIQQDPQLVARIHQVLTGTRAREDDDQSEIEVLSGIRSTIESLPLASSITDAVTGFFEVQASLRRIRAPEAKTSLAMAVRSSGTLEDLADTSYAGQYLTVLNLSTVADILLGIKKCWASMWEAHVLSYRGALQASHQSPSMAVLIMVQIESIVSGVMFTSNPLTHSYNEYVIESVWGQGEGLVSGELTPDQFVWDKHNKVFSKQVVNDKPHKFGLVAGGGTSKLETTAEEAKAASLKSEQLEQLVALGDRIMAFYRKPQDIEWAFDETGHYVLQSRAITTLDKKESPIKRPTGVYVPPGPGFWTLDLAHWPSRVTKFAEGYAEGARIGFQQSTKSTGLLVDYLRHAYVNSCVYIQIVLVEPEEIPNRIATSVQWWEQKKWIEERHYIDTVFFPECVARHLEMQKIDKAALNDSELPEYIEKCIQHAYQSWVNHHKYSFNSILVVSDFVGQVANWTGVPFGDVLPVFEGASAASRGLSSTPEMKTLVDAILQNEEASALIADEQKDGFTELLSFAGEIGKAAQALYDRSAQTLVSGYEIASPTVCEVPGLFTTNVRLAIRLRSTPESTKGKEIAAALRAKVPSEHQAQFDELLAEAFAHYHIRDERGLLTDLWGCGIARHGFLELGRRLVRAGKLKDDPTLIIDASAEEMRAFAKGETPVTSEELLRRQTLRTTTSPALAPSHFGTPSPPPALDGLPPSALRSMRALNLMVSHLFTTVELKDEPDALNGLAASPGVVEGTARVVLGPSEFHLLQQGDIMVTTSTSASFNIVLPLISGIVTDFGATLSHAAIVAREFGLPCVVSTLRATEKLKSGMRIRLDGSAGRVTIIAS